MINNVAAPNTDNIDIRDWSSGLCNCFGDVGECCFAFFCPLCYQVKLFIDADETCCSCMFGGLVPLRTKIRTRNKIKVCFENKSYNFYLIFSLKGFNIFGLLCSSMVRFLCHCSNGNWTKKYKNNFLKKVIKYTNFNMFL